jgi:hypothetical protein
MADLECIECHGEPPDLVAQPNPMLCVLCHEEGYDEMQAEWQTEIEGLVTRLAAALEEPLPAGADAAAREEAERLLRAVRADRSRGVHNHEFARQLLAGALEALGQ